MMSPTEIIEALHDFRMLVARHAPEMIVAFDDAMRLSLADQRQAQADLELIRWMARAPKTRAFKSLDLLTHPDKWVNKGRTVELLAQELHKRIVNYIELNAMQMRMVETGALGPIGNTPQDQQRRRNDLEGCERQARAEQEQHARDEQATQNRAQARQQQKETPASVLKELDKWKRRLTELDLELQRVSGPGADPAEIQEVERNYGTVNGKILAVEKKLQKMMGAQSQQPDPAEAARRQAEAQQQRDAAEAQRLFELDERRRKAAEALRKQQEAAEAQRKTDEARRRIEEQQREAAERQRLAEAERQRVAAIAAEAARVAAAAPPAPARRRPNF